MSWSRVGWWTGLVAVVVPMTSVGVVLANRLGEPGQQGWTDLPFFVLPWVAAFLYIRATRAGSVAELVSMGVLAVYAGFFVQDRIEEAVGGRAWWTALPRTAVIGLVLLPVFWLRSRSAQRPSSRRA